jgi:S1-C subfamily serine protease
MALKRHHKIVIGSLSTFLIAVLIVNSVLIYFLFIKITVQYNDLKTEVADTQSKISDLSDNLLKTQEDLDTELSSLKATASSDFSGIIEDAITSVVTVRTDVAQGTGFLITDDGYLVTNAHVLEGGKLVYVINSEQQKIDAQFVGYNSELDVALLKISGDYDSLHIDDSNQIQVGEKVIAIGNPLGLQFSVSEGIVSAIHREGPSGYDAYIQTDAALNPGNSGGPLINTEGNVIGINNFKVSGGESLGFALESNYLRDTINLISENILNETLI